MQLEELRGRIPDEFIEAAAAQGITALTPPQELAVENGLLDGKSFVVAAPTASGKTLIAEMAIIKSAIERKRKAVYVAPMRALVSEKFADFRRFYPSLRIAMSIGDLDALDQWLTEYDIVLASTEKLDSLIRHGAGWLGEAGCLVFDEVHMLGDQGRGPTLEILMTRLRRLCKDAQMLALSATVGNSNELAGWLNAELVESDYRPVALEKGVEFGSVIHYGDREEKLSGTHKLPELRITQDTLEKKKQILLFYSTKRNAESGAEKLGEVVYGCLSSAERKALESLSKTAVSALDSPTTQCEKLGRAIRNGVAFHHSGLVNEQRKLVEDAFRQGLLKALCSTTTLGIGVNLPAHTVVVRDTSRYSEAGGAERIGVNEVTQLFGRAGRPKYDKSGRALLIARSGDEITDLYDRYIAGELEPIVSKLGVKPILRTHVLAFVATRFLTNEDSILGFLSETLYGYQYSSLSELREITREVLGELEKWGFLEKRGSVYSTTRLGGRVSELYIDPLSARWILDSLMKERDDTANLFMLANTVEMRPYVRETEDAAEAFMHYQYMLSGNSVNYDSEELLFYDPIKPLSTALMLRRWINEIPERELTQAYRTTPGAIYAKVTNADWLLYACTELGKIARVNTRPLLELRIRMKYGIKKELVDLVRLRQVGRARARLLYDNGIRSVADLRKEGAATRVELLFGKEISKIILEQVKTL